jgi:N-acetylneuraminate synthase
MNNKVLIIAEAGVNHNGNVDLAKKLIDIAAESKVDFVKFQTWITEDNIDISAEKADYQIINDGQGTQFDMAKKLELSFENFKELQAYSKNKGVKFLSTPEDKKSLNFLVDELNLEYIKIGSGELDNIPFLRLVGKKNKDVILSTGMANYGEIENAINELTINGAKSVTLLHCTTSYPAPLSSINLKAIQTLKDAFKLNVGYSDHTEDIEISLAAVSLGAKIIEKHFTIDKNMPGPDHKASLNPNELTDLVKKIRNIEQALEGSGKKEVQQIEEKNKNIIRKGIYLNSDLNKGDIITEEKLVYKRPANGIALKYFDLIINKPIRQKKIKGEPLFLNDIDFN